MESLKELYRIGRGPSSSHTMGPSFAAQRFRAAYPEADSFQVTLFGSRAKTGKGHLTDVAVKEALEPLPSQIIFDTETATLPHPNTMTLEAFQRGERLGLWRVMSVGGGKIAIEGAPEADPPKVYPLSKFTDIKNYCRERDIYLWQYAEQCEGPEIWDYLSNVWETMKEAVYRGIRRDGELSGGLGVQRKAMYLNRQRHMDESKETRENRKVCAYAFAVSEENAGGGVIVTAPTCGACGVLPAVMVYKQEQQGFSDRDMLKGLAAAGPCGDIPYGHGPDRIRRRGGHGAPLRAHLRPHRGACADTLHRAKRRGGYEGHKRFKPCELPHIHQEDKLRHGGKDHVRDRPGPVQQVPGDQRGRAGEGIYRVKKLSRRAYLLSAVTV